MIRNSYLKPVYNHKIIRENENYFRNVAPGCANDINLIVNELHYCNICHPKFNFVHKKNLLQQQTIIFEQLHLTYIILLN